MKKSVIASALLASLFASSAFAACVPTKTVDESLAQYNSWKAEFNNKSAKQYTAPNVRTVTTVEKDKDGNPVLDKDKKPVERTLHITTYKLIENWKDSCVIQAFQDSLCKSGSENMTVAITADEISKEVKNAVENSVLGVCNAYYDAKGEKEHTHYSPATSNDDGSKPIKLVPVGSASTKQAEVDAKAKMTTQK